MQTVIDKLIRSADRHARADEYISGSYWNANENKGCSVGCSIEDLKKIGVLNGVDHGDHWRRTTATCSPQFNE